MFRSHEFVIRDDDLHLYPLPDLLDNNNDDGCDSDGNHDDNKPDDDNARAKDTVFFSFILLNFMNKLKSVFTKWVND